MNINYLKSFYYTAKLRSFSNAAKYLQTSQPTVTRQVQELQVELNLSLINKNKKHVELTEEGKRIYSISKDFFESEKMITAGISDFVNEHKKNIRIYSTETFAIHYFSYIYPDFYRENPDVYISLETLPDSQVVLNTIDMKCDFGILSKKVVNPFLTVKEVLEDRIVLMCPPDSKFSEKESVDPDEIDGLENVLYMEKDCGTMESVNKFLIRNRIKVNVTGDFSNSEMIKNFVKSGLGYGFIAENVIKSEQERGEIHSVRINDPELKRKFYVAYNSQKIMKSPVEDILERMFEWGGEFV
jgi:LysR family transcriptional regulator, transcriptional activator of the cysJI operon